MSLIKPHFKLRKPKAKLTSIYMVMYLKGGERFIYGTGLKVNPRYWEEVDDRVKYTGKDDIETIQHNLINKKLDEYREEVYDILRDFNKKQEVPTKEEIRYKLDKTFKPNSSNARANLIDIARRVIEDCESGDRLNKNGQKISPITIKGYNTTIFHLEKFLEKNSHSLHPDKINIDFYKKFIQYFHGKNKSTNTIGKNIKNIKVFMKEAYRYGLTHNRIWLNEDFVTTEESSDQIYLTMDELKRIDELEFKGDELMQRTRDLFLLACFTGLRSGDLEKLSKNNLLEGGEMIKLRMKKTGGVVVIPLHAMARKIIQKYKGNPPEMIENYLFNRKLKDLGEMANIKEVVTKTITKGGLREDSAKPKYEFITVHTARRSFATNMYLAGVPAISIMKVTGHKSEKSFLKYIRITAEENAQMLLKHSFFTEN